MSSYPSKGCGISKYSEKLIGALNDEGVETASGRVFFLREKLCSSLRLAGMARETSKARPDIIHVQYTPTICGPFFPLFLAWIRMSARRGRIVLTCHEKPSVYMKHLGGPARILFRAHETAVYALSHLVLVHTEEHQRELSSRFLVGPGKLETVRHGVDDATAVTAEQLDDLRRRYGLDSRTFITCLGIVRPNKGLEYLLQAMRLVLADGHDPVLMIAGGLAADRPGYLDELKEMARELSLDEHVVFTGYVEDHQLPSVVEASQFLVLPYVEATQSGVLHREAISYRKPVVATDVGGIGDLVKRYDIGIVVPPADTPALARALSRMLSDPDLRASFSANEQALGASMSWERIAREHVDAYMRAGRP